MADCVTASACFLCPRKCGADRQNGKTGFCKVSEGLLLARAALHMWEEPCISGDQGSGTIFFTGCSLRCVYCQNSQLSNAEFGIPVSVEKLAELMLDLAAKGAHNINLVTPSHYAYKIKKSVLLAKEKGLSLPIVWNTGGYESVETLMELEGVVDIYLTDFKYMDETLSERYSKAKDYPEVCKTALAEMVRQCGKAEFDNKGMMKRGVIVRHLLLPGHVKEAKDVVSYIQDRYGDLVYLSLMNQYTPFDRIKEQYPELDRRVTKREYARLLNYAMNLGLENVFFQEGDTAKESFIPAFDGTGL